MSDFIFHLFYFPLFIYILLHQIKFKCLSGLFQFDTVWRVIPGFFPSGNIGYEWNLEVLENTCLDGHDKQLILFLGLRTHWLS